MNPSVFTRSSGFQAECENHIAMDLTGCVSEEQDHEIFSDLL